MILWGLETAQPSYPLKGRFKPILNRISLYPTCPEIYVGQTQLFEVVAVDQHGQKMAIKPEDISWDTTGGSIDSNGLFTAGQVEGKFKITATVVKIKKSASVIISEPPQLTTLVIQSKHYLRLEFGKNKTFKLQGFDQRGNLMKIDQVQWSCSCGRIDKKEEEWVFQAGYNAGKFKIEAILGNVQHSVNVTIVAPPKLRTLSISPQPIELQIGQHQRFTADGFDQYGNPFSISDISWSATGGYIDQQGQFTAGQQAEIVTITAKVGGISKSTDVTIIEPYRLTKLKIEPVKIEIEPDQEQQFKVKGFDQRDQTFSVEKVKWETTGGGKINKNGKFTADSHAKGVFKITATVADHNISAVAEIVVIPVLKTLYIFPEEIALKPKQSFQFDIAGFDQTDELIQIDAVKWECTAGGNITQNGTLTVGFGKSEVLITATVNDIKGYAIATVLPVLTQIKIEPNENVILYPNWQQAFTAIGLDQYNKQIEVGEIFWEATGGKIDQQGNLTVAEDAKGEYEVTATVTEFPTSKSKQKLLMLGIYIKLIIIFIKYIESLQANPFFKILTDPFSRNLIGKLTDGSATLNPSGEEQQNSALKSPTDSNFVTEEQASLETESLQGFDQTIDADFVTKQSDNTQLESTAEVSGYTPENLDANSDLSSWQINFNLTEFIQEKILQFLLYIFNIVADLLIDKAQISDSIKVLIPPVLTTLLVSPQKVDISANESITFTALGFDQKNAPIPVKEVLWKSTSGIIDSTDRIFIAKNTLGQVWVTAFIGNITDSAIVIVHPEEAEKFEERLNQELEEQTEAELGTEIDEELEEQTEAELGTEIDEELEEQTEAELGTEIDEELEEQTEAELDDELNEQFLNAEETEVELDDEFDDELEAKLNEQFLNAKETDDELDDEFLDAEELEAKLEEEPNKEFFSDEELENEFLNNDVLCDDFLDLFYENLTSGWEYVIQLDEEFLNNDFISNSMGNLGGDISYEDLKIYWEYALEFDEDFKKWFFNHSFLVNNITYFPYKTYRNLINCWEYIFLHKPFIKDP